jgi:hypothetical protein
LLRQKINEFIGAVRAWLRAHGFASLAEYSNTDLHTYGRTPARAWPRSHHRRA